MFADTLEGLFQFRPFDVEKDIPGLSWLLTEMEQVDQSGEDISVETITAQLALPGHDPAQDRQVVTDHDSTMLGFSLVWKVPQNTHADVYVGVHPLWRKRGIGSALLQRAVARARELHPQTILVYADVRHQEALRFLQYRSFSPVAAYTALRCASDTLLPQPEWPAGYTLRAYDPSHDFSLLLDMYNRAFQGLWGHWEAVTAADLHRILARQRSIDNFLLYSPTGEVVGTCRGTINEKDSKREGYLDCPGVVPERRADNLYLPLFLHAAQWVRSQGATAIETDSWGDDPRVLAQYQQAGFKHVRQQKIYCLSCNSRKE